MSIRSIVNDFLNKTTDARFKRDAFGRLVFYPMGFGSGRVVPDAQTEEILRRGSKRLMIVILALVVPLLSAFNAFYQLQGITFFLFFLGCLAIGFIGQLYPLWLSRKLERSDERLSVGSAMLGSLDGFGKRFLVLGLVASAFMAASAGLFLIFGSSGGIADPTAMIISVLFFAPLTVVYAIALRRKCRAAAS